MKELASATLIRYDFLVRSLLREQDSAAWGRKCIARKMGRFRPATGCRCSGLRIRATNGFVRYYNPIVGRWISGDPIAELGGLNLGATWPNDLQNYIDVLGLRLAVFYPGYPQRRPPPVRYWKPGKILGGTWRAKWPDELATVKREWVFWEKVSVLHVRPTVTEYWYQEVPGNPALTEKFEKHEKEHANHHETRWATLKSEVDEYDLKKFCVPCGTKATEMIEAARVFQFLDATVEDERIDNRDYGWTISVEAQRNSALEKYKRLKTDFEQMCRRN